MGLHKASIELLPTIFTMERAFGQMDESHLSPYIIDSYTTNTVVVISQDYKPHGLPLLVRTSADSKEVCKLEHLA